MGDFNYGSGSKGSGQGSQTLVLPHTAGTPQTDIPVKGHMSVSKVSKPIVSASGPFQVRLALDIISQ